MWDWLGDDLAIDFANTLKREGREYVDLLATGDDLAEWARREQGRVPAVPAAAAAPRLGEVRAVRDDVFAVLAATAAAEPRPAPATRRLNERLLHTPVVTLLDAGPHVAADADDVDGLLALATAATARLLAAAGDVLALCDAPSCGQFFLRERGNQRWCGPACGNRARVARHAHAAA